MDTNEVSAGASKEDSSAKAAKDTSDQDTIPSAPYRDYSQEASPRVTDSGKFKMQTFPMKLHEILSRPEFEHAITWLPHGRAWRISSHKEFEEKVIPLYFRHGRYSSFARQVNGWGFKRIVMGTDYNAYYNEKFLRGQPNLAATMKRLTPQDIAKAKREKEAVAPDFYAISRKFPLPYDELPPSAKPAPKSVKAPDQPPQQYAPVLLQPHAPMVIPPSMATLVGPDTNNLYAANERPPQDQQNQNIDDLRGLEALAHRRNEILQHIGALMDGPSPVNHLNGQLDGASHSFGQSGGISAVAPAPGMGPTAQNVPAEALLMAMLDQMGSGASNPAASLHQHQPFEQMGGVVPNPVTSLHLQHQHLQAVTSRPEPSSDDILAFLQSQLPQAGNQQQQSSSNRALTSMLPPHLLEQLAAIQQAGNQQQISGNGAPTALPRQLLQQLASSQQTQRGDTMTNLLMQHQPGSRFQQVAGGNSQPQSSSTDASASLQRQLQQLAASNQQRQRDESSVMASLQRMSQQPQGNSNEASGTDLQMLLQQLMRKQNQQGFR